MSNTDKIMKDIFNCEFEDVRAEKRKKSRKKKKTVDTEDKSVIITSNDEGVEIVSDGPKFVEWKRGKRRNWTFDPNKPITEWKAWDLFEFAHQLYVKKYNKEWNLRRQGNSLVILQIFEKLESKFGSNNYLLMRDYVIYFFEKHIDNFVKRKANNDSFFDHMNRKDVIKSFCVSYDCRKNFMKYDEIKREKVEKTVSNGDLESAYLLSVGTLVSDYGIILAINWLVVKKKFKKKDAAKMVFDTCQSMYNKDVFSMIVESTEKYSPYPDWLIFKKCSIITDRISENIEINVKFLKSEKKRLDFLKERG